MDTLQPYERRRYITTAGYKTRPGSGSLVLKTISILVVTFVTLRGWLYAHFSILEISLPDYGFRLSKGCADHLIILRVNY